MSATIPSEMWAYVVSKAGPPEALERRRWPVPAVTDGRVLVRVEAFGLNRAEMFTRQGHSPTVKFPRVIGIECVGTVVAAPGTGLQPGQTVAAMMGGMGRQYDGSYAEYSSIPAEHVFPITTSLDWATLGALPEMFQTVNGSLTVGLDARPGEALLIRGGTSSIGMTTATIAQQRGLRVWATTRNPAKRERLLEQGVDGVIIDTGAIADEARRVMPGGFDKVLELVGTVTLKDSLRCVRPGGVVCMTGILGNAWTFDAFSPMTDIPTGVRLTSYGGGSGDVTREALQGYIDAVAAGESPVRIARVFGFDELVEAHHHMEESRGAGKLVVRVRGGV